MTPKTMTIIAVLSVAAFGSWYLARSDVEDRKSTTPIDHEHVGYYLKQARILGTGESGDLLYEIEAEHAEQRADARIEFTAVQVRYAPQSNVAWTVNANEATLREGSPRIELRGDVRVISDHSNADEATEITTQYLEFDPDRYVAETDQRVQLRFGTRSVTATGMLASLNDDKIELRSNVRGRITP